MSPEDAEMLKMMVQARSGVVINPANTYQLETALGPIARREGATSVAELVSRIRATRDERLMWAVTEAMSPADSAFYRDPAVFAALTETILPAFAGRERPVRVWSAACAGGQEAYSLAMAAEDAKASMKGTRVEIFASDMSETCIGKARSGLYTQFEVQRGLPIRKLLAHFEKHDEMWRVAEPLTRQVRWRRINLLSDLSPLGQFDVVACRNVVSHFDRPTRRRVLDQLRGLIGADGWLLLGAAERADEFEGLYPSTVAPGVFTPRPQGAAEAA